MAVGKYMTHVKPKLFLIECWARDGVIDVDIAKKLGISIQSFYTYQKEHIEFFDALKKGKEVIDFEVENALLKRALGFQYEEIKTYSGKDEFGETISKVEKTLKQALPDTTAQIFWLKNRKMKEWTRLESEKINMEKEKLEKEKEKETADNDIRIVLEGQAKEWGV